MHRLRLQKRTKRKEVEVWDGDLPRISGHHLYFEGDDTTLADADQSVDILHHTLSRLADRELGFLYKDHKWTVCQGELSQLKPEALVKRLHTAALTKKRRICCVPLERVWLLACANKRCDFDVRAGDEKDAGLAVPANPDCWPEWLCPRCRDDREH